MPKHKLGQIVSMVDRMEKDHSRVHERMDDDMSRYILDDYKGELDENGDPIMDDFKKVTSNDPRNYANLAIHLISTAKRIVTVPQGKSQKDERETRNMKELFALGNLVSADERRNNLMMAPLQAALASQNTIRGGWAQRTMLVKEEIDPTPEQEAERKQFEELGLADFLEDIPTTRTYVDVTDLDPRNTYWGMGKHGIVWACHKQMKSREEIEEEYPDVKLPSEPVNDPSGYANTEKLHYVYDFLDEEDNLVIVDNQETIAKPRTKHGMSRCPVSIGRAGHLPLFQANGEDYQANYGESIFANDRGIFDQNNFMLSYIAEMCKRALNPTTIVESQDGTKTLDENPNLSGSIVPIKSQGLEKIGQLPPQEMIQTGQLFLGAIQGMMQRGGFNANTFGQQEFQLSGFAITQLRQGQELTAGPAIDATQRALKDIVNILADGYATGNFDTMTLSGRMQDSSRTYFNEEITPDVVSEGGMIEVKLVADLPQDDAAKVALAQLLRDGDVPLSDDRYLRENVLMIQDADQMQRAIDEQMAKRGSPVAVAFGNMLAAAEQGDMELAKLWETDFRTQLIQQLTAMQAAQIQAAQLGIGGGQPGQPGQSQQPQQRRLGAGVLPPAVQGVPPPTPTPQQGAIAAPNTPRPNRNVNSAGLRDFGLFN